MHLVGRQGSANELLVLALLATHLNGDLRLILLNKLLDLVELVQLVLVVNQLIIATIRGI